MKKKKTMKTDNIKKISLIKRNIKNDLKMDMKSSVVLCERYHSRNNKRGRNKMEGVRSSSREHLIFT